MKTKYFKIIKIILIASALLMAFTTMVQADSIFDGADTFIDTGKTQLSTSGGDGGAAATANVVNELGGILVSAAGYILVIGVIVVGIKYMMANPEGKAKLKGQLIGLAVATIVIFGAQFIWSTIVGVFE